MNYVCDLILNFTDIYSSLEFYEWNKNDQYVYIEKIPIYVVNDTSMKDISNSLIKIDKELLNEIHNKTYTNKNKLEYTVLVTDRVRVIALMFNRDGLLIKKSSLLIDEEDAVIDDILDSNLDVFNYEVISKIETNTFFTRNEREIKSNLLGEINYLYKNKEYDELNYLYYEIYSNNVSIKDKYNKLLDIINNNNFDKIKYLYEIIKLTKEKSY